MFKKKWLAGMLALLLIVSMTGCGATASDKAVSYSNGAAAPEALYDGIMEDSMEMPMEPGAGITAESSTAQSNQKLIKTVNIRAETEDLNALLSALDQRVTQLGGYIENRDLYNGNANSGYRAKHANMKVRVPAQKLEDFVTHMEGVSNILYCNESQENVTLTYVDMESRMLALRTEQTRLLELLAKAENMTDLLKIEERLTEVRYQLESITSKLRAMDNLVEYATVELDLQQVEVFTETEKQTVWQRIGNGFVKNIGNVWNGLVNFFVWIVTFSPQLLIIAGIAVLIVILSKRSAKKRRAKRQTQMPNYYQPQQYRNPEENQK